MLPKTTQLHQLRHEWILRRANRPYVPEPDGTPMPDAAANAEEKARLYNVYLRPWVLDHGDASLAVPHITDLNLCDAVGRASSKRKRLTTKTENLVERSFKVAWHEYIRHRIVSLHAKRIIAQFMAACCGKSITEDPVSSTTSFLPSEAEEKEPCNVALDFVHGIISQGSKASSDVRTDEVVEGLKMSDQIKCSLRLGSALWSFDSRSWDTDEVNTLGHRFGQTLPSNRQARKQQCLADVVF